MAKTRHAPLVTQPDMGMKEKDWDSKDKRLCRKEKDCDKRKR
jgi:hypothetical protein